MFEETTTLRERLGADLDVFESMEAIVSTTFGFVPEFFENNVLPVLFQAEGRGETRRRAQVNSRLASCPLCVFYDMSTQPRGGGEYRYQSCAVNLPHGGVFHPKVLVVAGRTVEGALGVLVLVSSANLTFKGWAHNEEIAGTLWIETEQQRDELDVFLDYLERLPGIHTTETGAKVQGRRVTRIEALSRVRTTLKNLPSLRKRGDFPELRFFGLGRADEASIVDCVTPGRTRWESLTILSPYWSGREDTKKLAQRFRARSWTFVPAPTATGVRVCLGLSDGEQFTECRVVDEDLRRFRHAKMYLAYDKDSDRARVAVGSANFTTAALGTQNSPPKNVEALVAYDFPRKIARDFFSQLDVLNPRSKVEIVDGMDDDGEVRLPFAIVVTYDWNLRRYSVVLSSISKARDFLLSLPDVPPFPIEPGEKEFWDVRPPGKTREFSVRYVHQPDGSDPKTHTAYGLITEFGLGSSDHRYTPALKLEDFFASWAGSEDHVYQHFAEATPVDDLEAEADPAAALLGSWDDSPVDQLDATNLFSFYKSLKTFEDNRLKPQEGEEITPNALRDMLVGRPDSVYELVRLLERQETNIGVRYALLLECQRLFETYGIKPKGIIPDEIVNRVRDAMQRARESVLSSLVEIPRVGTKAQDTLTWFEKELKKGWNS